MIFDDTIKVLQVLHRYGRYSLSIVPDIYEEKRSLLVFIKKHLKIDLDLQNEFLHPPNTNQIRKFVGRIGERYLVARL